MEKMRLALTLSVLLILCSAAFGQVPTREFVPVQKGFMPVGEQTPLYREGRVMVKFTRSGVAGLAIHEGVANKAGQPLELGLPSVDEAVRPYRLSAIARNLKFEPRDAFQADDLGALRWYELDFSIDGDMEAVAARLRQDPNVEDASPDYLAFPMAVPNDPLHPNHWGHNNTVQLPDLDWGGTYSHTLPNTVGTFGFDANAQAAWDGTQGYGSSSVVIAIIDSGVQVNHPDLLQVAGWDYGSGDSNPDDNSSQSGHGTACAGVAAARANNGIGVAGAAGGCSIMPLKVANNAGSMFFSAIVNAIYHAADNGADIISMSLGAAISSDSATNTAMQYATNAGVLVMAATGNENRSTISYPAINGNCMGIGAASPCGDRKRSSSNSGEVNPGVSTDPNGYTCDGERWWGSNYGTTTAGAAGAVDIIAPTILPTTDRLGSAGYASGDYSLFFNGTSCATPYAAGVAALIKSKNPSWTPAQIKDQLTSTAQDIVNVESGSGWDRYSGYGMVDAAAAVGGGGGPVAPVANFSATPTSGVAPLSVAFTDLSTNSPTSWNWTFGDGGSSSSQNPNHVYTSTGTFTVTLTATNAAGSDGETKTGYITVSGGGGGSWTTITYDGFESGMGSYTDGGADMSRYTGGTFAFAGNAAADVQDNSGTASSFYHTGNYNVSGYDDLEVEFYFVMISMETNENFYVEYYNGSAWQIVANFVSSGSLVNNQFYVTTVQIPRSTYNYPTNAKLRFRCDASNNSDDVYIDEITWRGFSGSAKMATEDRTPSGTTQFALAQNYPNPFNPRTTIEFSLAAPSLVKLTVYDLRGREVAVLAEQSYTAGTHRLEWTPQGIASGVYYYRIQAGEFVQTKQMILLK